MPLGNSVLLINTTRRATEVTSTNSIHYCHRPLFYALDCAIESIIARKYPFLFHQYAGPQTTMLLSRYTPRQYVVNVCLLPLLLLLPLPPVFVAACCRCHNRASTRHNLQSSVQSQDNQSDACPRWLHATPINRFLNDSMRVRLMVDQAPGRTCVCILAQLHSPTAHCCPSAHKRMPVASFYRSTTAPTADIMNGQQTASRSAAALPSLPDLITSIRCRNSSTRDQRQQQQYYLIRDDI